MPQSPTPSIDDIYRKLQGGTGHELVTLDNVGALIQMATQRDDTLLESILREWQNDCTMPSTRGPLLDGDASLNLSSRNVRH